MDKYRCINDVFTHRQKEGFKILPVKGKEYTLVEIVRGSKGEGFVFAELPNPSHPNGQPYSFRPSRFVPVDEVNYDSLMEKVKVYAD